MKKEKTKTICTMDMFSDNKAVNRRQNDCNAYKYIFFQPIFDMLQIDFC